MRRCIIQSPILVTVLIGFNTNVDKSILRISDLVSEEKKKKVFFFYIKENRYKKMIFITTIFYNIPFHKKLISLLIDKLNEDKNIW